MKELYSGFWDGPHATPKESDSGPVYLGIKNIAEDGQLDFSDIRHISEENYPTWIRRVEPKPGDIVFTYEATLHRYAIIPEGFRGCLGRRLALLRLNPSVVNTRFLFYYFFGQEWRKTVSKYMVLGSTVDRIPIIEFPNFEVYLPPLLTQHKIAAVLSAYDDLIENNTRRIRILEQLAQAVYREWFAHFRFPGHEGVRKVDGLAEGWEVVKLSSLVETQYGYTESASDAEIGPKFVRGMDINKTTYIQWDQVPYCPINADELPRYKLNVGDIMVIRMADPGKVGIVEKEVKAVFASYLIRLKIKSPKLSPYYLFYYLLSDHYQDYVTGASTGTTRKSASAGVITDIEFVLPPERLRRQFGDYATALREMLNNLLDRNANLRRTRDLLLPRLVGGEIDVKNVYISELGG